MPKGGKGGPSVGKVVSAFVLISAPTPTLPQAIRRVEDEDTQVYAQDPIEGNVILRKGYYGHQARPHD